MDNIDQKSSNDILSLGDDKATSLFNGDLENVKSIFRSLARQWHPDLNSDPLAVTVFLHISKLRDVALLKLGFKSNKIMNDMQHSFMRSDGSGGYKFTYIAKHDGDLGSIFIGQRSIAYHIPSSFYDVAEFENNQLGSLQYADDSMKNEMKRFLPVQEAFWDSGDNGFVSVIRRSPDQVLLQDLLNHQNGRIDPLHVAWIVSGLMNIACYLNWRGVTHGAISPLNILVSPELHAVSLVGGWGFLTKFGERPIALPERTTSLLPRLSLKGELVDETVDLQLIRATGQELLGCYGGGGLHLMKDVPQAMKQWLMLPPPVDAFEDYSRWSTALDNAYGKRKFVDFGINAADVYGV